jgi:hypothetical protein
MSTLLVGRLSLARTAVIVAGNNRRAEGLLRAQRAYRSPVGVSHTGS